MSEVEKMTRKEILQPNKAEKLLYSFVDHAYRNRRFYIIIAIFSVVFLMTLWGIRQYFKKLSVDQANLFHNARAKLSNSLIPEEDRISQGILELQKFTKTESSSSLGALALLELGKIYAEQSMIDESISEFKKVIDHPEATSFLKNVSRLSLSTLYEQKQNWDDAIAILNSIDTDSWNDLRWRAMARIAISKGEIKEAKKLLEKILKKFTDSLYRHETETLLMTL